MATNTSFNSATVPLPSAFGGTGVANTGTITVGGNTAFSGAFTFAGTVTGNTAITFPTSGTLATTAGASGIVSSGTANQLGYYASSGTTISGLTSANNGILVTNGSGVPSIGTTIPFTVPVTTGGTGVTTMTTAYAPVCAGTTATGALQVASSGQGTSGFVLTSTGSASLPTWQAASGGGFTWNNVSGTTQTATVNNGYIIGNASQTTVTLPTTAALGSVVSVQGKGAAGWILAAGTGQTIQVGQSATSTAGSVTSAAAFDSISVVCITANTSWATSYILSSGATIA